VNKKGVLLVLTHCQLATSGIDPTETVKQYETVAYFSRKIQGISQIISATNQQGDIWSTNEAICRSGATVPDSPWVPSVGSLHGGDLKKPMD
jgi:hypothetical protein